MNDLPGAARAFDQGLALAMQSGDNWYQAFALYLSGLAATVRGDTALARDGPPKAPSVHQDGDQRAVGYCLVVQGDCLIRDGFPADAVPLLREGMGMFDALPERWVCYTGPACWPWPPQRSATGRRWPPCSGSRTP